MKSAEIALGLRLLSRLTGSVMSMGRVIEIFPDVAPPPWRRPALQIRGAILRGLPLSTALAQTVPHFPAPLAAIIRAGEEGLGLPPAIARAAAEAERIDAARKALTQALAYPVFLVASSMVTLTILLVVVLPRFAGLLSDMQQTLPPAAQLLVTISSGVPALLVIGGGLGAVGALSVHMTRRHADGRAALDRALLAIPVIGRLMHDASIVSITSTLASLLATGVPVADAVQICQGITSNEHTNCGLVRVRRDIVRGSSLSLALGTNAIITRAHVGILRAGEEVGSVPQSLEHIASLARDQLDARLRRTLATLEPAAILIVGGLIAIIAGILMQTIYAIQP